MVIIGVNLCLMVVFNDVYWCLMVFIGDYWCLMMFLGV